MKKLVLAIAIVAVLAMAFTSVGYAYTASTENSGNDVTSQYVTLTQQNYTFASSGVSFDVIDSEAGTKYQLRGTSERLIDIDGKLYYGVRMGTDKLSASVTGASYTRLGISVESYNIADGFFTDYSKDVFGWRYVLKVTDDYSAEKTVAEINEAADPATGTTYWIKDAGTLTKGALNVTVGDVVRFSGSVWELTPVQYAYYVGTPNSPWNVTSRAVTGENYTVLDADADDGGYIVLYDAPSSSGYTVIKVTRDTATVIENKAAGSGVEGVQGMYVNGRAIVGNTYTVSASDACDGKFIVLYDTPSGIDKYRVVNVTGNTATVTAAASALDAGSTVPANGYTVGGKKLDIEVGKTYATALYFAGVGEDSASTLMLDSASIKATTQISITPVWVPATAEDAKTMTRYTLKSGEGVGNDIVCYFVTGTKLILPDNPFTHPTKKFVGWLPSDMEKVYEPWHLMTVGDSRDFTAQWAGSDVWTVAAHSLGSKTVTQINNLNNPRSNDAYIISDAGTITAGGVSVIAGDVVRFSGTVWTVAAHSLGSKTVAEINAIQNPVVGYAYIMSNAGTITGGVAVTANDVVRFDGDEYYTVTFNSGGGNGSMETAYIKKVDVGSTYTLPFSGFAKPGYRFNGWEVVGDVSGAEPYAEYKTHMTDVPLVKENLTLTATWIQAPEGHQHVSISDGYSYSVVKVPTGSAGIGDAYVMTDGGTITAGGVTVTAGDAVWCNGMLWKKVGGSKSVEQINELTPAPEAGDTYLMTDGGTITDGPTVAASDVIMFDEGAWKVIAHSLGSKTVAQINEIPFPQLISGLKAGSTVDGVQGWHVNGRTIPSSSYAVTASDAGAGKYIVLYQTPNDTNYNIIMIHGYAAGMLKNQASGALVVDVEDWKVNKNGYGIYGDKYKVNGGDACGGYITLYANSAMNYVRVTVEDGKYTLPHTIFPPLAITNADGFLGWKCLGWSVSEHAGRTVPQSYIMPYGTDGYIISNGIIKFRYSNDIRNGEELA